MSKMSHWLVARLEAVDTLYTVVITRLTKVYTSIPPPPLYSQLGYVSHCMLMTFDNYSLNLRASLLCQVAEPFAGAVYVQRIIWIFADVGCEVLAGFFIISLAGGQTERGEARVSGSVWVNRKCIKRGEATQSVTIAAHRVGERQRDEEREIMATLLLSHPILDSLQHELTFYIQSRMWVALALLKAQWTLIKLASFVGFYAGIYN